MYLRATAMYTDGEGSGKSASAESANMVLAAATGGTLLDRYDTDPDGVSGEIDKSEVIMAINDYLYGVGDAAITKADVIEVINLYLYS